VSNGDDPTKLSPISIQQNPLPVDDSGQEFEKAVRAQVENILAEFQQVLPSSYVSLVTGPAYTIKFQAAAEELARFQITAQEVFEDNDFDFTRSEFLWQTLGALVFPTGSTTGEIPEIPGDISYREFLRNMVLLLLRGAKPDVVEEGIELLTDAEITIIEKALHIDNPISAWTLDNQFQFEVFVSQDDGTDFPDRPFVLQENVRLVLQALKPAHALYEYHHLFKEVIETLFSDEFSMELSTYYYEDFRKFCAGVKELVGTEGETMTTRTIFRDVTRDFSNISEGMLLTVDSGPNAGDVFCVEEIAILPSGTDDTPRSYTTSPTGLSGSLTVDGIDFEDLSQDFSAAVEGELLTITDGPNAGVYRLKTLLGTNGGPVGEASGPATRVRPGPSLLYLDRRMDYAATRQEYRVDVERLGVLTPYTVTGEDASRYFYA
jgi:hypothetical protein